MPGETVLAGANRAGVSIAADCAGNGKCGSCRVRLISGGLSPLTPEEARLLPDADRRSGVRLACRAIPESDAVIEIVPPDAGADKGALQFPADFLPKQHGAGMAYDIGTTTLAAMLTKDGRVLGASAVENPQRAFGADVISRIDACMQDKSSILRLQQAAVTALNTLTYGLLADAGLTGGDIHSAMAVGNTTMTHLLLGESPLSLARAPFEPAFYSHEPVRAPEVGLDLAPDAMLSVLPNIAGHVGGDITAAILSARLDEATAPIMLIDIGTNGEMAFYNDGRLIVCSTAAGPAFEGACISCGMRAAAGAITAAELTGGRLKLAVYDNARPAGVCGSGLIDIMALLIDCGAVDASGRLLDGDTALDRGVCGDIARRISGEGRSREFVLYEDAVCRVALTQKDIREVQLAKAAIAAGAGIMLSELGLAPDGLGSVLIAGAFGSRIRPAGARRLGLIPDVPLERVRQLGNAAGAGACMALMSDAEKERAGRIAERAEHIVLASHRDFQREFIGCMKF